MPVIKAYCLRSQTSKAPRGGVIIFFFLSAFLISGPFLTRPRTSLHWRSWLAYWTRRLCRIVPLYYLVLLAAFYFHLNPFHHHPPSSVLFEHLSFQDGWSIFWTIAVEMRFYFVLPILLIPMAWVLQTIKHGHLILGLAILTWLAA
jgi:peptidoglycan/LPS O-acetylase OafA/YrhL